MAQTHEDFSREHPVKASSNRTFGSVFVAVFLIYAFWPLVFGGVPRWWSLVAALLLALITVATPSLLTVPNRLWLRIGLLMHRVVNVVALAIIFYLVVTPTGLIMRALGKDLLRQRNSDSVESYWLPRDPPGPAPSSMSNQF